MNGATNVWLPVISGSVENLLNCSSPHFISSICPSSSVDETSNLPIFWLLSGLLVYSTRRSNMPYERKSNFPFCLNRNSVNVHMPSFCWLFGKTSAWCDYSLYFSKSWTFWFLQASLFCLKSHFFLDTYLETYHSLCMSAFFEVDALSGRILPLDC